jgi:phosphoglycerate dehydrogenase-like enzyme
MTTILCALPEDTYQRMRMSEFEAELHGMGSVIFCRQPRELSEAEYGALWEESDAVITGWGFRAPTVETLQRADRLKIICHTAGSVRGIPRYAIEKGIIVTSARAAIARTVAEFCLLNAMILLRRYLVYTDTNPSRTGFYQAAGKRIVNETLYDKTVGLIGFGFVGRYFRELLRPFGCPTLVFDPYMSEEEASRLQVEKTDLPALLKRSKIVSLHAPDIPETRRMIGATELAMIPDGAILLNSARGRIVDTDALTEELKTGRLFSALDVTDPEPLPPDHPLRTLPNVLWTPHVAGPTTDELPRMTRMALNDLARFLRGEQPLYPITLEAYDRMSF